MNIGDLIPIGGSGNLLPSEAIATKTFSSDAGDQVGTMVNRGTIILTPSTVDQTISVGYHNGLGKVLGDTDLVAPNILSGKTVFGVAGTCIEFTTSGGTAYMVHDDGNFNIDSNMNGASDWTAYAGNVIGTLHYKGTARFSFTLDWSVTGKTGYARWYNITKGISYTERTFTGTTGTIFTEDIAFDDGDEFVIQIKYPGVSSGTFYVNARTITGNFPITMFT